MTELKNFTPHTIHIMDNEHRIILELPSNGIARVETAQREANSLNINGVLIEQCETEFGEVTGLPEQKEGTIYIVSSIVKSASKRSDLRIPTNFVRNTKGDIVGCKTLSK